MCHPGFPKMISNLNLSDHRLVLYSEVILNQPLLKKDGYVCQSCSHMSYSLNGDFRNRSCLKMTGIQYSFFTCTLDTEISPHSLTLLIILCTVDGNIFKVFIILHWVTLLICSTICVGTFFFIDWWTPTHLYFWETLSLQNFLF